MITVIKGTAWLTEFFSGLLYLWLQLFMEKSWSRESQPPWPPLSLGLAQLGSFPRRRSPPLRGEEVRDRVWA